MSMCCWQVGKLGTGNEGNENDVFVTDIWHIEGILVFVTDIWHLVGILMVLMNSELGDLLLRTQLPDHTNCSTLYSSKSPFILGYFSSLILIPRWEPKFSRTRWRTCVLRRCSQMLHHCVQLLFRFVADFQDQLLSGFPPGLYIRSSLRVKRLTVTDDHFVTI